MIQYVLTKASANPRGVYTMEKTTFTIAELTGFSFWDFSWPILIIFTIVLLVACGDMLEVLVAVLYNESWLQRRIQRIRWKIAVFIYPELAEQQEYMKYYEYYSVYPPIKSRLKARFNSSENDGGMKNG